ncbi:MAG: hypothetical protein NVSMB17_16140 [Candidatus Dormibacteria bacterium]
MAIVAPTPSPTVAAQAPEAYFLTQGHSAWVESRSYRLPAPLPRLQGRVDGPVSRVAGLLEREVGTPLAQRRLNEVVLGRSNQAATRPLCAAGGGVVPTGFSPDDALLALYDGRDTLIVDLAGQHAASRLLAGRLLSWR